MATPITIAETKIRKRSRHLACWKGAPSLGRRSRPCPFDGLCHYLLSFALRDHGHV